MREWRVETDVGDSAAYAAFATDRLWCGYAIADLEPPFRAFSRVAVARLGGEVAACLVLRTPAFNAVVPHGPGAGLEAILARSELPSQTHLFALDEHLEPLRRRFMYADPVPMLRMAVDAASSCASPDVASADRLGSPDLAALIDLFAAYPENAFQPEIAHRRVLWDPRWPALAGRGRHARALFSVRHRRRRQHLHPPGSPRPWPRRRMFERSRRRAASWRLRRSDPERRASEHRSATGLYPARLPRTSSALRGNGKPTRFAPRNFERGHATLT